MINNLTISTTQPPVRTNNEFNALNVDGTYAANVAEGTESYKKYLAADDEVKRLRSQEPVPEQALKTALNNRNTALMLVLNEMEKNSDYINNNPDLIDSLDADQLAELSAMIEARTGSTNGGTMKDQWKNIYDYVNGKLDKDIAAGEKAEQFQEDYLAWLALKGPNTSPYKNAKGEVDSSGVIVNFANLKGPLGTLITKYKGSAGTLNGFNGPDKKQNELDAKAWARDNFGLPERCVTESPPGSGTWVVKIDVQPLIEMQTLLLEMEKKAKENGKGGADPGYLITAQFSALETGYDTRQRALETQVDKSNKLLMMFKEQTDALWQRINEWLADEAERMKIANQ